MLRWTRLLSRRRRPRRGEITIEWILLTTVLGIGVIGGLGTARNAIIVELKDVADAITALEFFP